MTTQTNSQGVPLGPRGFVICQHEHCGKEVSDVSREVSFEYAKCEPCRRTARVQAEKKTITSTSNEGDGNMASKTKYRDPATKAKDVLANTPRKREVIAAKLKEAGYKESTVQAQIYNLSHWNGCLVTDDGYAKNPDFIEPEKPVKAKKEKKEKVAKVKKEKKTKAKTFRPAPKPSQAA